ncbi:MAG: hypothetical protein JWL59_4182 [Chthoniobacteraceae bacterium]|nr:hypothetical protein [Chthoniobacteraceae bacterium]
MNPVSAVPGWQTLFLSARPQMRKPFSPACRQPQRLHFGHLKHRQHLAGSDKERVIGGTADLKRTPEAAAFDTFKAAFNQKFVAKLGGALVIDLSTDKDRIDSVSGHVSEAHPELLGEMGARHLDKTQISEVMHDGGAIGIEEHDLDFG